MSRVYMLVGMMLDSEDFKIKLVIIYQKSSEDVFVN